MLIRPRLAWPFTIVPRGDEVWLVAGEDVRFTLRAEHAAAWLPALLDRCRGAHALDALLADVPAASRSAARDLLESLAGERILVEGGPLDASPPAPGGVIVESTGRLADALRERLAGGSAGAIRILAQDDLDLAAAVAAGRRWRAEGVRGLWTSVGPLARAYVGPVLLHDTGPCLTCLLGHFRLLSPLPEVYDVLLGHRGPFAAADVGEPVIALAADLVAAKLALIGREPARAALFALHVIEVASLEVTSHRVFRDSECTACSGT